MSAYGVFCCVLMLVVLQGSAWQLKPLVGASRPVSAWCSQYEWSCSKGDCWDSRCSSAPTAANSVALAAGQPLLLAAKHWNGGGGGSWQVRWLQHRHVAACSWITSRLSALHNLTSHDLFSPDWWLCWGDRTNARNIQPWVFCASTHSLSWSLAVFLAACQVGIFSV